MEYTVIDFETANPHPHSACALGIIHFSDGQPTYSKKFILRPVPFKFADYNLKLHGITPAMCESAPTFAEIFPEIKPYIDSQIIVAHNAPFDISVLRRTADSQQIPLPPFKILDTLRLAQAAFPELCVYRLDVLSSMFNIPLEHHDPLSDVIACSKLLELIADGDSLDELCERLDVTPGYFYPGTSPFNVQYCPCRCHATSQHANTKRKVLSETAVNGYIDDDFVGRKFVFTGALSFFKREEAIKIVEAGGGKVCNSVSKNTNVLVCGHDNGAESRKFKDAQELRANGVDIIVINEDEFIQMIDPELLSVDLRSSIDLFSSYVQSFEEEPLPEPAVLSAPPENYSPVILSQDDILHCCAPLFQAYKYPVDDDRIISFSLSKDETTISVKFFGTKAFEYIVSGKWKGYVSLSSDLIHFLPMQFQSNAVSMVSAFGGCRVPVATESDLALVIPPLFEYCLKSVQPTFDCCHLFQKCSDELQCANDNPSQSLFCGYRKKLEKGIVFFGENRNID